MEPWQERVIREREELLVKIKSLDDFIESSTVFQNLSTHEQQLLKDQAWAMIHYDETLETRIKAFK